MDSPSHDDWMEKQRNAAIVKNDKLHDGHDVEVDKDLTPYVSTARTADGKPVRSLASRDVILDKSLTQQQLNPGILSLLKSNPRLMVAIGVGAMGGFMFGYDSGIIGSVQSFTGYNNMMGFYDDLGQGSAQALASQAAASPDGLANGQTAAFWNDQVGIITDRNSWVTSSLTLACAFTALFAGPTGEYFGRKYAVLFGAVVVTIGGIIQAAAVSYGMMLAGRVVSGLAIGTLSTVVPWYVSEVAPKKLRGVLGTVWQLNITLGIMIANCVNLGFGGATGTEGTFDSWRYALGIQSAFSIALAFLVFLIPESPRYLVERGKSDKAAHVLNQIRQSIVVGKHATNNRDVTAVELEVADIEEEVDFYRTHETGTYLDLIKPDMWLRTSIGICLQFFQQLTGVNAIFYYGPTILQLIGLQPVSSQTYISVVNFGSTVLVPIFLMDYLGRRTLLLWGAVGMAVSNFIITALFFTAPNNANVTGNLPNSFGNAILAFICIFIFHFAIAWGPIPWLYPTEIYPVRVRGKGVAIATFSDWIANFMISKTVNNMLRPDSFSPGGVFAFFAAFATIAGIWSFFIIRETSGVVLERMDLLFTVNSWASFRKYVSLNVRYSFTWDKKKAQEIKMTPVWDREGEAAAVANVDLIEISRTSAVANGAESDTEQVV